MLAQLNCARPLALVKYLQKNVYSVILSGHITYTYLYYTQLPSGITTNTSSN